MKREYKEFAIKTMYGIIVTTPESLKHSISKRFPMQFGIQPDNIEVIQTDKLIDLENDRNIWVGTMELLLTVEGETYSVIRDWLDEYMVDRRHPNYNDDYFYESEDCYSHKRYKQLIEGLG